MAPLTKLAALASCLAAASGAALPESHSSSSTETVSVPHTGAVKPTGTGRVHKTSTTRKHAPLPTGSTSKHGVHGPVFNHTFADPSLIDVNGTWYSFATANPGIHIQIAKSADFKTWEHLQKDALPDLSGARWISHANVSADVHPWAPDVIRSPNGSFIMSFSAPSAATGQRCLGVATSDQIEGPYSPERDSLLCSDTNKVGYIDQSYFSASNGSLYMVYKHYTQNANNQTTVLTLREMQSSGPRWGLDFANSSSPVPLLQNRPQDSPGIEAPFLTERNGVYFLSYSAHYFASPAYNVEYATADKIEGPYTRASKPLLKTGDFPALNGPGGASFAKTGNQMVFHNRFAIAQQQQPAGSKSGSGSLRPKTTSTRRGAGHANPTGGIKPGGAIPISQLSAVSSIGARNAAASSTSTMSTATLPSGAVSGTTARRPATFEPAKAGASAVPKSGKHLTRLLWTGIVDFEGKIMTFKPQNGTTTRPDPSRNPAGPSSTSETGQFPSCLACEGEAGIEVEGKLY